ncbi:hypothetical protein D6D22_10385 [Aureobasidium pullulans]|uniref:Multicopper oxidase, type 1 n=1 Tax=Aureobasidium pullulans TaxID=5580 RepID=A0A4S8WZ20_AURPU|nr:hypothetical protein D6D22_10385 [Aureobasidium pullulans]
MVLPVILLASLCLARSGFAAVRSHNFTIHTGERAPDGFSREVYLINNQQPAPHIEADEGDTLEIFVKNELAVETTIHWHGMLQRGTPDMDGVPGVTQNAIVPGGNFTYRFSLNDQYGFYWYHSHFRAYYNDAIRGTITVHPKKSRGRPFQSLAAYDRDYIALLEAERKAVPVMLTDWYHNLSDEVYHDYMQTGAFPSCVDSLLANGMGRVQCLPQQILDCGTKLCIGPNDSSSMDMGSSTMSLAMSSTMPMDMPLSSSTSASMSMSSTSMSNTMQRMERQKRQMSSMKNMSSSLGPRGCVPMTMFKAGYNSSSLGPETCTKTTSALFITSANASLGWLALDLVNAGSTTKLSVSLDSHSMFVYAADGLYVEMQEVKVLPLAIGQRYSVMIKLDQLPSRYLLRFAATPIGDMQQVIEDVAIVEYTSDGAVVLDQPNSSTNISTDALLDIYDDSDTVHMLVNGSAKGAASSLVAESLAPFERTPPPAGRAVETKHFNISQTDIVVWVVNGYPYSEPKTPIIYGNVSDGWNANTTLHMPFNSTVDIIMRIANDSMDNMGHPMHLHGHKFWVLGTGDGDFPYASVNDAPESLLNLDNPPYRDTVELPASGWAAIRYFTDNPGAWLLHCHLQWHLVSGMAVVLVEGDEELFGLVANSNSTTITQSPSNATSSDQPIANSSISASAQTLVPWLASIVPWLASIFAALWAELCMM